MTKLLFQVYQLLGRRWVRLSIVKQ